MQPWGDRVRHTLATAQQYIYGYEIQPMCVIKSFNNFLYTCSLVCLIKTVLTNSPTIWGKKKNVGSGVRELTSNPTSTLTG